MSKKRKNGRVEKPRPPKVVGLLIREANKSEDFFYLVRYDCPYCGAEHQIRVCKTPPVEITTECGRGIAKMHRIEEPQME